MGDMLSRLTLPGDLKDLQPAELEKVAAEIRTHLVRTVAYNGGHLAANLGVVELTLALHSTFDSPRDRIIWDVGHQSYPHKLLTGRLRQFHTLRQFDGLSGFPKPSESEHDAFGTGHSSTSVSAALGLARARDFHGDDYKVIAVIGDGALTGGMAYEALNHAGHLNTGLMVVLNDNEMSIGSNVGAMSAYLQRIRTNPRYSRLKTTFEQVANRIPVVGKKVVSSAERLKGGLKYLVMPGLLFEELGLTYLGPVDGHNIAAMKTIFQRASRVKGPVLVHVITEKGKGYSYAEESPERFHGIGPFNLKNGLPRSAKVSHPSYTEVFGRTLEQLGKENPKIVAITAAMTVGTGLTYFAESFPERFYDVGIAEQHGVTMAAALAASGMQPVVAIYSTFLQRALDQVIHDVCIQKFPVVFAVDRAGIVGEDGETHQGLFDYTHLRSIPNMSIMAPRNEAELQQMLYTAFRSAPGPVALRYPRGEGEGVELGPPGELPWGKGELLREGENLLIVAAGSTANAALASAGKLFWQGVKAAVINARFVKPLDHELILTWARKCGMVLTVEENVLAGGFGSGVMELLEKNGLYLPVKRIGVDDQFVKHGPREYILSLHRLDAEGIYRTALSFARRKAVEGSG